MRKRVDEEKISSGEVLKKLDELYSDDDKINYLREILKNPINAFNSQSGYVSLHIHLAHLYEAEAERLAQEGNFEEAKKLQANALAIYKNFRYGGEKNVKEQSAKKKLNKYRYQKSLDFLLNSVEIISILAFIFGLIFLSLTVTGSVIGNLSIKTSSLIGVIVIVLGIVGVFVSIKKR